MPLWAVQGKRFEQQQEIWDNICLDDSLELSKSQAESFLEPESQTLERRYRPGHTESFILDSPDNQNGNLSLISERYREFGQLNFASSTLHEEKELELAPEIEVERQVQRPPIRTPVEHQVDDDICDFVATGILKLPSPAYKPAFQSLSNTSVASITDLNQVPTDLLATTYFAMAVSNPAKVNGVSGILDAFQRPVRWILTSPPPSPSGSTRTVEHMIITSPYEAYCLRPDIRLSKCVTLHQYVPRQNFAFGSLDKLSLYNVPENSGTIELPDRLRILLNLFAGQLYLESYAEYQRFCAFLRVASVATYGDLCVDAHGFIRDNEGAAFRQSPIKFLKVLMSQIRKDAQDIDKTHVGRILNGLLLSPSDFTDLA
jgi:hypothetical protein